MLGAKSGRTARQNLTVFGNVILETLDVFVIDVVDMPLAILANALLRGARAAADLVVAIVYFVTVFILFPDWIKLILLFF